MDSFPTLPFTLLSSLIAAYTGAKILLQSLGQKTEKVREPVSCKTYFYQNLQRNIAQSPFLLGDVTYILPLVTGLAATIGVILSFLENKKIKADAKSRKRPMPTRAKVSKSKQPPKLELVKPLAPLAQQASDENEDEDDEQWQQLPDFNHPLLDSNYRGTESDKEDLGMQANLKVPRVLPEELASEEKVGDNFPKDRKKFFLTSTLNIAEIPRGDEPKETTTPVYEETHNYHMVKAEDPKNLGREPEDWDEKSSKKSDGTWAVSNVIVVKEPPPRPEPPSPRPKGMFDGCFCCLDPFQEARMYHVAPGVARMMKTAQKEKKKAERFSIANRLRWRKKEGKPKRQLDSEYDEDMTTVTTLSAPKRVAFKLPKNKSALLTA